MAAPDATTSTAVVAFPANGDAMLVQWTNPETGDAADYVQIEVSDDGGGSWDPVACVVGDATSYTHWNGGSGLTFRTRRVNGDGASAWDTMTAAAEPPVVVLAAGAQTRVILLVGEYWGGSAPVNALSDFGSNYQYWARRISRLYEPTPALTAFTWNHVGLTFPISAVTPNSPVAGDTKITTSQPHGRTVGAVFRVDFRSTGIAGLDSPDGFDVEVLSSTELAIRGFVASGSASTGFVDVPSVDTYSGDANSNTDRSQTNGAYPSTTWGADYSLMRDVQDRVNDEAGGLDTVILVKVDRAHPLRGRPSATGKRWLQEFDGDDVDSNGVYLSGWREIDVVLRDLKAWLTQFRPGPDIIVEAIGISVGLNDGGIGTPATTKRTIPIDSITVSGATATITTSSAHGLSEPAAGKSRLVGRVTGIEDDTLSIDGQIVELTVASTTTFTINDLDATGLGDPTVEAGATQIQVADPGYFYDEDLPLFVSDLRDLVETRLGVPADEQLAVVVRVDPSSATYLDLFIQNVVDRVPATIPNARIVDMADLDRLSSTAPTLSPTVTGSFVVTAATQTATKATGGLSVFTPGDIVSFVGGANNGKLMLAQAVTDTAIVFSPYAGAPALLVDETATITIARIYFGVSQFFYSADGLLRFGERLSATIARTTAGDLITAKTPAIMVMCIGDSYVEGVSYLQFSLDNDPRLISPSDEPTQGLMVWRSDTQEWDEFWVDSSGTNVNRHPEWNATKTAPGTQTLSIQPSLLVGLRERYPDETVWIINLAKNGSTLATVPIDTPTLQYPLAAAALTTDGVIFQLANGVKVTSERDFPVLLDGVSGLSTDINGLRTATPILFDSANGGTSFFQVDSVGITGTPSVSGATAGIRPPAWEQSANELFATLEEEFAAAIQAMWEAGYVPDFRGIYALLGLNDAALGTHNEFADGLAGFVDTLRTMVRTQGRPREFDVPVVWLNPIQHEDMSATTAANLPTIRDAIAAQAQADPYFAVLSLDEDEDWLENPAVISRDTIHPTFRGYVEIGYRLARTGLAGVTGFDARHPVDFTPQVPTGGVAP